MSIILAVVTYSENNFGGLMLKYTFRTQRNFIRRCPVQISVGTAALLTANLPGFPQENFGIVPYVRHKSLFLHAFQIIAHCQQATKRHTLGGTQVNYEKKHIIICMSHLSVFLRQNTSNCMTSSFHGNILLSNSRTF